MTFKLDLLDKKILNALNENVREPYSRIAKKVRSSKEVVNYRIKRLMDEGIIKEMVTTFSLGYSAFKILIQFQKVSSSGEKEILDYLKNHPYANWVTPCSGNWDLVFSVMAKNPKHFDKIFREIIGEIGDKINDYKIAISTGSLTFGHTYILGSVKEAKKKKRDTKPEINFDEKDKKIAKILHKNCRESLTSIAQKTKIPVDTVKYRIKKMVENQIIRRYRLILDTSKLGYNRYEIFIRGINLTDKVIMRFSEWAKQNKHVEYMGRYIGAWDLELTVNLKSNTDLRKFVLEIKQEFGDQIKSFESIALFETLNFIYLPLELQ
jgi:DNA-binding Lrp family transcriptional regulator